MPKCIFKTQRSRAFGPGERWQRNEKPLRALALLGFEAHEVSLFLGFRSALLQRFILLSQEGANAELLRSNKERVPGFQLVPQHGIFVATFGGIKNNSEPPKVPGRSGPLKGHYHWRNTVAGISRALNWRKDACQCSLTTLRCGIRPRSGARS